MSEPAEQEPEEPTRATKQAATKQAAEATPEPDPAYDPRFKRYRLLVNYIGLGAGNWIEINPEEEGWWQPIEERWIVSEEDWEGPADG